MLTTCECRMRCAANTFKSGVASFLCRAIAISNVESLTLLRHCCRTPLYRGMSSRLASSRAFQLQIDPLTGSSQWMVIDEEDCLDDQHRDLLAVTSYLDMLNDRRRNTLFRKAIEKTVTKPSHVLDIGAGTGLLSMMVRRWMNSVSPRDGEVTACESYLPMVKLASKVLKLNGMENSVKVINKRSDDLIVGVDINSRADVLVSEILDSELLGEGLIPTLQHAHDNLLVGRPQTVPHRATVFGQLVESNYLRRLHDLFGNEANAYDDVHLVPSGLETVLRVKPQQYAFHCDALDDVTLLSEPFKVFELEFWKRPESYRETNVLIKAAKSGTVHAVISWWTLQLDSDATIFYSTSPKWISTLTSCGVTENGPHWCDHWRQCVWFIPGMGIPIVKGDKLYIDCAHTDKHISYSIKTKALEEEVKPYQLAHEDCQIMLNPERVAIYGDKDWRFSIFTTIKHALQQKDSCACVVADDSIFLTVLILHLSKSAHVVSLFPGLRDKALRYLEAVSGENSFSVNRVRVLGKSSAHLTLNDIYKEKVDLLVGEPFYYGYEGGLPWQNLRFWKERSFLDHVLSKDAIIIPSKGVLKACAMSLPDLWRSRSGLTEVEGFDHSVANDILGARGNMPDDEQTPCLPFFIWQCGDVEALSKEHTVMEFDFYKQICPCSGNVKVELTRGGVCHGFVLWIDWVMDNNNSVVVTTGPDSRYWKQGVRLLREPVSTSNDKQCGFSSAMLQASFLPSTGDLFVKCNFLP